MDRGGFGNYTPVHFDFRRPGTDAAPIGIFGESLLHCRRLTVLGPLGLFSGPVPTQRVLLCSGRRRKSRKHSGGRFL